MKKLLKIRQFIINCVSAIVNIFMLKETRANIILQKRAESVSV